MAAIVATQPPTPYPRYMHIPDAGIDDITFDVPTTNRYGNVIIPLAKPIVVETPPLLAPFGVSEYRAYDAPPDAPPESRTIDVEFPHDAEWFRCQMHRLDEAVQAAAADLTDVPVMDLYRPLVRPAGRYPPLMKIKLAPELDVQVPKGALIEADMYIDHVWILNGRWGMTWRAVYLDVVNV